MVDLGAKSVGDFELNKVFSLGQLSLTKSQIIEFATKWDPMPFHLDEKVAEESIFGALCASGWQLILEFYRQKWIPQFKDTVICGLGIRNAHLKQAAYADKIYTGTVRISELNRDEAKQRTFVNWVFEFRDENGKYVQGFELQVFHKFE